MQHRLWFIALSLVAAALDLWTKKTAFTHIPEGGLEVPVIEGFFSFGRTTNKGIVFGLFPQAGPVFLIISVLAVPAILAIFLSIKKPRWVLTAALALILGGTLGNMYDRVFNEGQVRDFIKFYYGQKVWPLFNLADAFICVGVFLLTIEMMFFDEKKKKEEAPAPPPAQPSVPAPPVAGPGPVVEGK